MKKNKYLIIFVLFSLGIPLMGFNWKVVTGDGQPSGRLWQDPATGQINTTPFPAGVNTWTFTPTNTATFTNTNTTIPTLTWTITNTPTFTPTGSNTATSTPTGTNTPMPTNTPAVAVNPNGVGFPLVDSRLKTQADMPVAIDSLGNIYASNNAGTVSEYDVNGNFVKNIGACCGSTNGKFAGDGVDALVVDASNNLWASDDTNTRVMEFDKYGVWQRNLTTNLGNAIYGLGVGPSTGNIYVADRANFMIRVYTSSGSLSTSWGMHAGGSVTPWDVKTDLTETWAYVSCDGIAVIEKHQVGGTWVVSYGSSGPGAGTFNSPAGLFVDFQNNLYVADSGNNLIQKLSSNGAFITQWGQSLQVVSGLFFPEFLTGDPSGGIYIADVSNNRIVKTNNTGYPLTHNP